jgi:hypothetical protein
LRPIACGSGSSPRVPPSSPHRWPIAELEEANALLSERTRELEEANRRLELLSTVDSLTEAANRRQFDHVLDAEWRRCARTGLPLALLMLYIDHFKPFNDGYGHVTGDVCLKKVRASSGGSYSARASWSPGTAARSSRSSCPGATRPTPVS